MTFKKAVAWAIVAPFAVILAPVWIPMWIGMWALETVAGEAL